MFASLSAPPDTVAALHAATSALAEAHWLLSPLLVTVHVLEILAAVHVAKFVVLAIQASLVPPVATVQLGLL